MASFLSDVPRGDSLLAAPDLRPPGEGPIMVATDGSEFSRPALEAALELSRFTHAPVRVIAVLELTPSFAYDYGAVTSLPEFMADARAQLLIRVKAQVVAVTGVGVDWTIVLRDGDPANEIARAASEAHARVLILGVRHRGIANRLFAREISIRTLRWSRTPVLVVPEGFSTRLTRMLVATDFSPGSVLAARTALQLFDAVTDVHLVHVSPLAAQLAPNFLPWVPIEEKNVEPGFERVKSELDLSPHVTVECVNLLGTPSSEIVDYARAHDIDLIVTGSRGAGFVDRLLTGSTSRGLVRGVPCAVLVVKPPADLDVPYPLLDQNQRSLPRNRWADELQAFTHRNMGRKASIEVDDPEFGAQAQEFDYPLLGVTFDHHDQRVGIMVGDFKGTARHLTRGIGDVKSIEILRDATGRDWILRIAHGAGQTILTFNRGQGTVRR